MTAARVVAIGGGHGLAATLRAVRRLPASVTAVVSVADDGGSSGRLRADRDRVAPGDLRKCLVALAGEPTALTDLMEHRFESGELKGHAFGNLLLAAMEESRGDLLAALDGVGQMLGSVGTVLPATADVVELVGMLDDGNEVVGQAGLVHMPGISRVRLAPSPVACPEALDAIAGADLVVLGPGSLFTSVLAAAVVPGIAEAVRSSPAGVVYVCNLAPQARETEGYTVADHLAALARHGIEPDVVLHDPERMGGVDGVPEGVRIVAARLAAANGLAHDPGRLADALGGLLP